MPLVVASMVFLAALAAAGVVGARAVASHWRVGAALVLTMLVPQPEAPLDGMPRLRRVLASLRTQRNVTSAEVLDAEAVERLLQPWFGTSGVPPGLTVPGVIEVRLASGSSPADAEALIATMRQSVPDVQTDAEDVWIGRLAGLAVSLQACAWMVLALVIFVAVLVVSAATRGGLVSRREAIRVVHGLGATDHYIASRFAKRNTVLAACGGAIGAAAAFPVLVLLTALAAPFVGSAIRTVPAIAPNWWDASMADASLPTELWCVLPALPVAAALIGCVTTQATVRRWLRELP